MTFSQNRPYNGEKTTAGWQNPCLYPRQVLKMRMMVRLWEGEPAHCTLWLPLKQRSLGTVTLPTLHSWWSHALTPRSVWGQSCRVREFSRLPLLLTSTASLVVPKTTLSFDGTYRTHWTVILVVTVYHSERMQIERCAWDNIQESSMSELPVILSQGSHGPYHLLPHQPGKLLELLTPEPLCQSLFEGLVM